MSWIVSSHIATFQKLRDSWTTSTVPNVETFPVAEGTPRKFREAFSKWTRFIGWEETCESRPEAKVPHLFCCWHVRTLTRYKSNWLLHSCPWKTLSPENSVPKCLLHCPGMSGSFRRRSVPGCLRRSTGIARGFTVQLGYLLVLWPRSAPCSSPWL